MPEAKGSAQQTVLQTVDSEDAGKAAVEGAIAQYGSDKTQMSTGQEALLRVLSKAIDSDGKLQSGHIDELIAQVDERVSRQVDRILHQGEFQQVESSWRALGYLVRNTDFRANIKLSLLDVSKDDLINDLEENLDITRSGYYKHIYANGLGQYGGTPVAAVIANYEFGPGQRDIDLLRKVASVSAMAHAPFISAVSKEMVGIDKDGSWEELPGQRDLAAVHEGARFAAWRGLREEPDARYLGMSMPRYLVRGVYTPDHVKQFHYEEDVSGSHEHYLWGNMSFAFASRLTAAFKHSGWAANIVGPNSGGGMKGLPVYTYVDPEGDEVMQIPAEVKISYRREYELSEAGFIPLMWKEGTDFAAFFGAASPKRPKNFPDTSEGRTNAMNDFLGTQLPYMFVICRLAHYIKAIQVEKIGQGMTSERLQKDLWNWLKQYVNPRATSDLEMARKPIREAKIVVSDIEERPGWYEVDLQVTPHFKYQGSHFTLSLVGKMEDPQS